MKRRAFFKVAAAPAVVTLLTLRSIGSKAAELPGDVKARGWSVVVRFRGGGVKEFPLPNARTREVVDSSGKQRMELWADNFVIEAHGETLDIDDLWVTSRRALRPTITLVKHRPWTKPFPTLLDQDTLTIDWRNKPVLTMTT